MRAIYYVLMLAAAFGAEVVMFEEAQAETPMPNDHSPMWSPDGKEIVFVSNRTGSMQIHVMNADGSAARHLTNGGGPSWAPDGNKIAFCSDRSGNDEIYIMDVNGKNLINLTNHPASDCGTPSWSPDGKKLTFMSNRDGDWENNPQDNLDVYVMNADGSGQTRLTKNRGFDLATGQAWTPDGGQVVFCSSGDKPFVAPEGASWDVLYQGFDIYRIGIDGTNQTRLTFTFGEDSYPNVSPDGREIYFARFLKESGTGYDIYKMTADGRVVTQVTNFAHNEGPTAWSPDGKKIVYAEFARSDQSIYVADADGSNPVKITNQGLE